jgi:hypothetical protein
LCHLQKGGRRRRPPRGSAPGRIRTSNPWIRSPPLYPLSYGRGDPHCNAGWPQCKPNTGPVAAAQAFYHTCQWSRACSAGRSGFGWPGCPGRRGHAAVIFDARDARLFGRVQRNGGRNLDSRCEPSKNDFCRFTPVIPPFRFNPFTTPAVPCSVKCGKSRNVPSHRFCAP